MTISAIRPSRNFDKLSDGEVVARATAALKGIFAPGSAFTAAPVTQAAFSTDIENLNAGIGAAVDGGKQAVSAKNELRAVVVSDLRLLGTYVEVICKGNQALFDSSGLVAVSTVRNPSQPLSQPVVTKIKQFTSGQLIVILSALRAAISYEMRYAALTNGIPGTWTITQLPRVRPAPVVDNLIPGTTYAFQVRAYGKLGFTSWSDSVTRMCI